METNSQICILSVLALLALASSVRSQNVLEKFVIDKLAGYGTWIREKNFDPSPLISGPTHLPSTGFIVIIDCYMSNHIAQGHSEGINITSVKADLDKITVSYEIQRNVTFSGKYVANGTVFFSDPVSGEGAWNITVPKIGFQEFSLGYAISDAGYVNITSQNLRRLTMPTNYDDEQVQINFENLWDDEDVAEYESHIKSALYSAFEKYVQDEMSHPVRQVFVDYFREIFQNTTWADIIIPSIPQPPTEETETPRYSSTTPYTTRSTSRVSSERTTPTLSTGSGGIYPSCSTVAGIVLIFFCLCLVAKI